MKVSVSWLRELVELNIDLNKLIELLPLRSISTKEVTADFFELDMKGYNRTDLLSMRGVATEIAAITGSKVLFNDPQKAYFVWNKHKLPNLHTVVDQAELAPYYALVKIYNLKSQPSTPEVQKKLADMGMRSIDAITDITNLTMLEYGQPMHAFDADQISGTIGVRKAKSGEKIVTIDNKERVLTTDDLVIVDDQGPVGIAGVMGGKNSEISSKTNTIYLEAAIFDSINIRQSAQRHNLPSEAAKRFQHGLTKTRHNQALNTAIQMYQEIGGVVSGISFVGEYPIHQPVIDLKLTKLNSLIGVEFDLAQVERYLKSLNFDVERTESGWKVIPPYYRLDINIAEDVIEEVARLYGYEKIQTVAIPESAALQKEDIIFHKVSDLRKKLVDLGLTEVQTYSFYSSHVLAALGFDDSNKKHLIKLQNPISSETEYLRMNLWPNLVEVTGHNIRQNLKDIAIFEIGRIFQTQPEGDMSEKQVISIALMNGGNNPLEELITIAKELDLQLQISKPEGVSVNLFHPVRFLQITEDSKPIGGLAEVHLKVLNQLGIEQRIAILEIKI